MRIKNNYILSNKIHNRMEISKLFLKIQFELYILRLKNLYF